MTSCGSSRSRWSFSGAAPRPLPLQLLPEEARLIAQRRRLEQLEEPLYAGLLAAEHLQREERALQASLQLKERDAGFREGGSGGVVRGWDLVTSRPTRSPQGCYEVVGQLLRVAGQLWVWTRNLDV